ncbi:SPFH domain-containing protein [Streptomyces sp. BH055]|uniref:SPFH domain-containing protein n=1 Tax=Streptomyces sp. BH055 TaxID=3401173 RepID=UPI003BB76EDA
MRRVRWLVSGAAAAAATAAGYYLSGGSVWVWCVIPDGSRAVAERFGRYHRVLKPGLNLMVPVADTLRTRLDMREQCVPFPVRVVSVHDGADLPVELTVQYSVVDPVKATYQVASYIQALERHTLYELSYALSKVSAHDARTSLSQVAEEVTRALTPRAERWGLRLHEVLAIVGEVEVTDVTDEARVSAGHEHSGGHVYASNVHTVNVIPHGQIEQQTDGRVGALSTWNIGRQEIQGGNVQQGDHNHQDNRTVLSTEEAHRARALVAELLRQLEQSHSAGDPAAALVHARTLSEELTQAEEAGRAPEAGRLRHAWQRLSAAVGPAALAVAGSATAQLVTDLGHAIGAV